METMDHDKLFPVLITLLQLSKPEQTRIAKKRKESLSNPYFNFW
jgi:hypothetical protein